MIEADKGNIDAFYANLKIALTKPLAYPLKRQIEQETTLQKFKDDPAFQDILQQSKE